jgi:hypothetical protein
MEEKNANNTGANEIDEKNIDISEVKQELDTCDTRLSELKGAASSQKLRTEFQEAEQHLKACRLIIDEIEGKSGDEVTDAKHRLVTSLRSMRRSLRHMGA